MSQVYSQKKIQFCPFCGAKMESVEMAQIGDVLHERGYVECQACGKVFRVSRPGQLKSSSRYRK